MTKHKAPPPPAVGSPVERGVGRLVPERDQDGPRGTYGCACVSRDARECMLMREGYRGDEAGYYDTCECLCHQWRDDDDDLG
jgi:hypothetical protein